jgi:hypothetical protein
MNMSGSGKGLEKLNGQGSIPDHEVLEFAHLVREKP